MAGEPTTIVIFGATGDLTRRKLIPAQFQLACKGRLPLPFHIVGFARQEFSDDRFRDSLGDGVREFSQLALQADEWAAFASGAFPESIRKSMTFLRFGVRRPDVSKATRLKRTPSTRLGDCSASGMLVAIRSTRPIGVIV